MPEARVDWSDERIEHLKTLWAAGQSCSQIARQIPEATRSAVIGKVHRLGLAGRENPKRPVQKTRAPSVPKSYRPPVPMQIPAMPLEPPLVLESGAFVTLETVTDRTCRWPIGDPQERNFHFCGNTPKAGKPFCEAHCKIGYQPLSATTRPIGEVDGRVASARRHPVRRGQVSLWE